jgi:hypothetical protein
MNDKAWLGLSGALILPFLVGSGRNQQQETKANVVFKAMLLIWIRIQLSPIFLARSDPDPRLHGTDLLTCLCVSFNLELTSDKNASLKTYSTYKQQKALKSCLRPLEVDSKIRIILLGLVKGSDPEPECHGRQIPHRDPE